METTATLQDLGVGSFSSDCWEKNRKAPSLGIVGRVNAGIPLSLAVHSNFSAKQWLLSQSGCVVMLCISHVQQEGQVAAQKHYQVLEINAKQCIHKDGEATARVGCAVLFLSLQNNDGVPSEKQGEKVGLCSLGNTEYMDQTSSDHLRQGWARIAFSCACQNLCSTCS